MALGIVLCFVPLIIRAEVGGSGGLVDSAPTGSLPEFVLCCQDNISSHDPKGTDRLPCHVEDQSSEHQLKHGLAMVGCGAGLSERAHGSVAVRNVDDLGRCCLVGLRASLMEGSDVSGRSCHHGAVLLGVVGHQGVDVLLGELFVHVLSIGSQGSLPRGWWTVPQLAAAVRRS